VIAGNGQAGAAEAGAGGLADAVKRDKVKGSRKGKKWGWRVSWLVHRGQYHGCYPATDCRFAHQSGQWHLRAGNGRLLGLHCRARPVLQGASLGLAARCGPGKGPDGGPRPADQRLLLTPWVLGGLQDGAVWQW